MLRPASETAALLSDLKVRLDRIVEAARAEGPLERPGREPLARRSRPLAREAGAGPPSKVHSGRCAEEARRTEQLVAAADARSKARSRQPARAAKALAPRRE